MREKMLEKLPEKLGRTFLHTTAGKVIAAVAAIAVAGGGAAGIVQYQNSVKKPETVQQEEAKAKENPKPTEAPEESASTATPEPTEVPATPTSSPEPTRPHLRYSSWQMMNIPPELPEILTNRNWNLYWLMAWMRLRTMRQPCMIRFIH